METSTPGSTRVSSALPVAGRRRPWRGLQAALAALLALIAAGVILALGIWPWIIRWGATDEEMDASLPGDDFVPEISTQTTKALTIRAAPEHIYPWLLQLGVDRGGMYSYTWIENLMGLHVTNTQEIMPAYQDVQVGDFLRFVPPDFPAQPGPGLYVMDMLPNEAFILCFTIEGESVESCPATWQFVLRPRADGTTRLILRNRITAGESWQNTRLGRLFLFPTFVMERKMLLTIKERAEALAADAVRGPAGMPRLNGSAGTPAIMPGDDGISAQP